MAITTSQYIINAGWARTDTIDQLEKAWTAISWNGAAAVSYTHLTLPTKA